MSIDTKIRQLHEDLRKNQLDLNAMTLTIHLYPKQIGQLIKGCKHIDYGKTFWSVSSVSVANLFDRVRNTGEVLEVFSRNYDLTEVKLIQVSLPVEFWQYAIYGVSYHIGDFKNSQEDILGLYELTGAIKLEMDEFAPEITEEIVRINKVLRLVELEQEKMEGAMKKYRRKILKILES